MTFNKTVGVFCSILLIFLMITPVVSARTVDMLDTSTFNLRIDGAAGNDNFGRGASEAVGDINNDGKNDLVIGAWQTGNNSRANSGSIYIFLNDELNISGTGNTLDLNDSGSYFLRIDGSAASQNMGMSKVIIADLNNNGKNDLIISTEKGSFNSASGSGVAYVIYDDILDDYTGTGNTIDLATTTTFNVRFEGSVANDRMTVGAVGDLDGDNKNDIILIADGADNNSRSASGSIYVIYNTLLDDYTGTGNAVRMNTGTNYNIRIDGPLATSLLGYTAGVKIVDFDNDGSNDIVLGGSGVGYNSRSLAGGIYVINNDRFSSYTSTGNTMDLATSTNWDIRIDGAVAGDRLGETIVVDDVDGDGLLDIVSGAWLAGNNSRSQSGSVYYFNHSLFNGLSGTGNTLDTSSSSTYSVRFDGDTGYRIGDVAINIYDYDYDGKLDLFLGANQASNNSRSTSGSLYYIANSLFNGQSTGSTFDLTDSTQYSVRYDGAVAGDSLGYERIESFDINNDDRNESIITALNTDNNSRNESGSLYIIYNFPHTINQTSGSRSGDTVTVTGTITATNSVTTISGVQYQIDSNSPSSGWSSTGCTADDGAFDETTESFTCSIASASSTSGDHTVYVRAYDQNTSYTAQSHYMSYLYNVGDGTGSGSTRKAQIAQLSNTEGGGAVVTAIQEAVTGVLPQSVLAIIEPHTFKFDAYLSSSIVVPNELGLLVNPITGSAVSLTAKSNTIHAQNILGLRTSSGIVWQVGNIQNVWYKAYAPGYETENAAKIIPELQDKPSIIAIKYTDLDLIPPGQPHTSFNPKTLKLAHSLDGVTWKILPTSVVDTINHTVAALDKIGGYYMIVAQTR